MDHKSEHDKLCQSIVSAKEKLATLEEFSETHFIANEKLELLTCLLISNSLKAGKALLFKSETGIFTLVSLSSKGEYKYQVTRCSLSGMMGDSQYSNIERIVSENGLSHQIVLSDSEAKEVMGGVATAETAYQETIHA